MVSKANEKLTFHQYTPCLRKKPTCQLIFCSVLVKYELISIKNDRRGLKEILNKTMQNVPTSPKICASTTLGNLK